MKLIGHKGPAKGMAWVLREERLTIGREENCDIYIPDPKISRLHAEIVRRGNQYVLHDNHSTNGTYLEGMRITEGVLQEGMTMRVGNSDLEVGLSSSDETFSWDESDATVTHQIAVGDLDDTLDRTRSSLSLELSQASREGGVQLSNEKSSELMRMVDHLDVVYSLSRDLSEIHSLEEILDSALAKMFEVFKEADRGCILLRDNSSGEFRPAKIQTKDEIIGMDFRISRSIFNRCVEESIGVLSLDAAADNRFAHAESIADLQLRSCMCAPMIVKGKAIGGVYLDNPEHAGAFDQKDLELLTALSNQVGMAYNNALLYENVQHAYHQSILALINTIEAKDPYTMGHTQRTMRYALGIGRAMGLSEKDLHTLERAAKLHDIGKIGVREQILLKDAALTDDEYNDIKAHVEIGVKILEPIDYLRDVIPIVRGHHEKFDGSGYPDGAAGEEIALGARILALADAFDAMTTQRPYNKPLGFQQALDRCREGEGKHFDPKCVDGLAAYLEESIGPGGVEFGRGASTRGGITMMSNLD